MPERVIIESESGWSIFAEICWSLFSLVVIIPIRFVFDLIRERRR
jgi:hypothetical protein